MMKKTILSSFMLVGVSSSALAHGTPTITLGGYVDTQVGFRNQKSDYELTNLDSATGRKLHNYGLVNDTKLFVNIDGHARNGVKYGGQVTLNADASNRKTVADKISLAGEIEDGTGLTSSGYGNSNNAYRVMTYVEGAFGRGEAGSTTGVYDAMRVNAGTIARATGGVDGDARFWWHPNIDRDTGGGDAAELVFDNYLTRPALPTSYDADMIAHANKFNYFTPEFRGFRGGVTYIPDTEVNGTISKATGVTKDVLANTGNELSFTDVWSGAVTWEGRYRQVGIAASATGEIGDAKSDPMGAVHDLRAWEVGGSLNYMNFTLAGSYGDWGKSGILKGAEDKVRSSFWNVGGSFVQGPFGFSVTYFESKKGQGLPEHTELSNLSFGADYQLAPGLMPYAEVSLFDIDQQNGQGLKNSGHIFLIGSKLSF